MQLFMVACTCARLDCIPPGALRLLRPACSTALQQYNQAYAALSLEVLSGTHKDSQCNSAVTDSPDGALSGGLLTQALQPRARATTHTDLQLRARALGIEVRVVHNASIISAVGACGLQLYRYGEASAHLFLSEQCCKKME